MAKTKFLYLLLLLPTAIASTCITGYYLNNSDCIPCINAPMYSNYTGPGDDLGNCPFSCMAGYTLSNNQCLTPCTTGQYYNSYSASCYSCVDAFTNAYYTTDGGQSVIGCSWSCNAGYTLSIGMCVIACFTGQYYNSYSASCLSCNDAPANAHVAQYTITGGASADGCWWSCNAGYAISSSLSECILTCAIGKYYDSFSASCLSCFNAPIYAYYTSDGGQDADGCSWSCNAGYALGNGECPPTCGVGKYYDLYSTDCYRCSDAPTNAYYTSDGGQDANGCSWSCNAGYNRSHESCIQSNSSSRDSASDIDFPATEVDTAMSATAGVAGGIILLLTITATLAWPAKPLSQSAPLPQGTCCDILTPARRPSALVAAWILAALVLLVCVAGDVLARFCQFDITTALGWAALGLDFLGGLALYLLSSCGCLLCCVKPPGACCNTAVQATAAIGVSLALWITSLGIITFCALNALSFARRTDYSSIRRAHALAELARACLAQHYIYYNLNPIIPPGVPAFIDPFGLLSFGGILAAAAILLQGRFITLVPEAVLANLNQGGGSTGPGGPAAEHPSTDGRSDTVFVQDLEVLPMPVYSTDAKDISLGSVTNLYLQSTVHVPTPVQITAPLPPPLINGQPFAA